MTKRTKKKIRNALEITRAICALLSIIFILITAISIDGASITTTLIFAAIATVNFGISYGIDKLIWTPNDKASPFTH